MPAETPAAAHDADFVLDSGGELLHGHYSEPLVVPSLAEAGADRLVAAVQRALRGRDDAIACGMIPFEQDTPAELFVVARPTRLPSPLRGTTGPLDASGDEASQGGQPVIAADDDARYRRTVTEALRHIEGGEVDKVVLARAVDIAVEADPGLTWWRSLAANASAHCFAVRLGDGILAGASPEMVAQMTSEGFATHPLAGSARRADSPGETRSRGLELLDSPKDHHEHHFVVDHTMSLALTRPARPAPGALDIALREAGERRAAPLRVAFFEAAAATSRHAGLLFEGASMQVAFAKDLATMRNPRSAFSFMQFLAEKGRLADFINRGSMAPLRIEFAEYLKWAADALAADVTYSSRVEAVTPVHEDGVITCYDVDVTGRDGASRLRSRHVVLATGLQPVMPDCLETGARVWHSGAYLARVGDLDAASPREIAVIGGGQSAAEVLLDLRDRFPETRVHSIHSRFGLMPSDASPFANQIFDPGSVDLLYEAPEAELTRIDVRHANTNDSVVSPATLQDLFDIDYRDKWLGRERFVWHRASRVVDAAGRPITTRRYQACFRAPSTGHLFLIGQTRHQHGVSATLVSNIAVRAGEITDAIIEAEARGEGAGTPGCAATPVPVEAQAEHAPARGTLAEAGAA